MNSGKNAVRTMLLASVAGLAICSQAHAQVADAAAAPAVANAQTNGKADLDQVVITASRVDLMGVAATASQGRVTQEELNLRPIYRVGQLLESMPGLVVTAHSGEGKANQYLVRGFNLDHGTDIANFVEDMPINRPTNTHGQGYSDVNFLMPEVTAGLDYTKGPYYASIGDSGSVASTRIKLANSIDNQVSASVGNFGIYNVFAGGTKHFSDTDRLLGGVYYGHVDGPWDNPDNFRKITGALRYSHGEDADGYSLTALYYHSLGNFTTDQPQRAFDQGLIGRFGSLDPTDGNRSERLSLSGHYGVTGDMWKLSAGAYVIHSRMTLWNNFTHYLDDPVNGDQEEQTEDRTTGGFQAALTLNSTWGALENELVLGLPLRYDDIYLDKRHTLKRKVLSTCSVERADDVALQVPAIQGACDADRVRLLDVGPYLQDTTRWTPWLRTILGLREEYYRAEDRSIVTGFNGNTDQYLFQPKGSLILGPWAKTELYFSAGRGFHSDDVRGVFGTVPLEGVPGAAGATPLLAQTSGLEFGLRTDIIPKLAIQLAVFQQDFDSELAYNADAGQDEASAPSRRRGIELSAQYHPWPWLELNTDLAFSQPRYRGDLTAFDLDGRYIANAPNFIGSFGALVDNLGPWFGGLQWRDLGAYPISDGPKDPQDKGYSEINLDFGYKFTEHFKLQLSIYNLFDTKANAAAYYYGARLPGEPDEGVEDYQVHPLEPLSAVLKATMTF